MLFDSQSNQAVLWHAGETLAEGSLTDCLRQWDVLPRLPRSRAYIQVVRPTGGRLCSSRVIFMELPYVNCTKARTS